jgi:hypothetical protein
MSFREHLTTFAGLEIVNFPNDPGDALPDVTGPVAWRVDSFPGWEEEVDFSGVFESFLERVDPATVTALVIGAWNYPDGEAPPQPQIMEALPRFTALRALFLGDIVQEQNDVAYIVQPDITPALTACPSLEELWIRGSSDWDYDAMAQVPLLRPVKHDALRVLVFQSGGLTGSTMRAVGECVFPVLEHLEFYFGEPDYSGDGTPEDVAWLFAGSRFPRLRRLGLRDSRDQDELAAALAHAPVVAQLEVLDLSLGTLGDDGAAALLAGQPLNHLLRLDLHHHYMSPEMCDRLVNAWPEVDIDVSEPQEAEVFERADGTLIVRRYIAVSE